MARTRNYLLAILCVALTGCASMGDRWPIFARRDGGHETASARKKLKDPRKLDLAYAKWQEEQGNLSEARERYQRVLHDEPQSVPALLGLARMDQLAGRMLEAEQGYRKALKIASNDPLALDALGQFYAAQSKWPLAIDTLKKAAQLAPADNIIRFHLAVVLAKSGDINAARPLFVNSVGDAEADYNLGLILHDQGKLEQSEQFFVQASVKKPTLEQAQYWLSEIRVEKETQQLLAGTSGRSRPELQAPAGAVPGNTALQAVAVEEQRLSPNDVLGIQQASGQSLPTGPAISAGAAAVSPNTRPSRSTNLFNPFGTGNPWSSVGSGNVPQDDSAAGNHSLTPQQLEQLRNQR